METAFQIAGAVVVGGAVLQMTLMLVSSLRRRMVEAEHARLSLDAFRERSRRWLEITEKEQDRTRHSWAGVRKLVVTKKVEEADNVVSLYLEPHDDNPLPLFSPGQHLTFRVRIPGSAKPVTRCYSLSNAPGGGFYRVTVKRLEHAEEGAEPRCGVVSGFFHDSVSEGDILDVMAPSGHFALDESTERPVVLVGGGVGVTPLASMAATICTETPHRETWLFHGSRNRREHIFREELGSLARSNENFTIVNVYSSPDSKEEDPVEKGRIDVELLRRYLPSSNYQFYVCGPPGMMQSIVPGLVDWGVPKSDIHFEAFGPASVVSHGVSAEEAEVVFSRSRKTVRWPGSGSLLELAEENSIGLDSGCRAGSCGSCVTAIKEGEFRYIIEPGNPPEAGSCLTCVAVPSGRLVLDA